uniref:THAP domain-containing protein 1 n=1 Tax=Oncorhynchus kisutch TaxID=8019 RepID=A0A8C7CID3_ONCKI
MTDVIKIRNCIAPGCRNWLQRNPSVSYHRLPKDPQLLKKWLHVPKRKDVSARASRICSQHFPEEDFEMKGTFDALSASPSILHFEGYDLMFAEK